MSAPLQVVSTITAVCHLTSQKYRMHRNSTTGSFVIMSLHGMPALGHLSNTSAHGGHLLGTLALSNPLQVLPSAPLRALPASYVCICR